MSFPTTAVKYRFNPKLPAGPRQSHVDLGQQDRFPNCSAAQPGAATHSPL